MTLAGPHRVRTVNWGSSGLNQVDNLNGNPLPTNLQQGQGAFTTPYDGTYTLFNASKHYQFDEDVAFFKSGWWGTHNIKVGYQFNRLSNVIDQNGNVPNVELFVGQNASTGKPLSHTPSTQNGAANCAILELNPWAHLCGRVWLCRDYGFRDRPAPTGN